LNPENTNISTLPHAEREKKFQTSATVNTEAQCQPKEKLVIIAVVLKQKVKKKKKNESKVIPETGRGGL
jgi:hypothetical protein